MRISDWSSDVCSSDLSQILLDEWDWSSRYPEQPEILRYLEFVADRLDLRRSFAFDTRVESMTWDDDTSRWIVRTDKDLTNDVLGKGVSVSVDLGCRRIIRTKRQNNDDIP